MWCAHFDDLTFAFCMFELVRLYVSVVNAYALCMCACFTNSESMVCECGTAPLSSCVRISESKHVRFSAKILMSFFRIKQTQVNRPPHDIIHTRMRLICGWIVSTNIDNGSRRNNMHRIEFSGKFCKFIQLIDSRFVNFWHTPVKINCEHRKRIESCNWKYKFPNIYHSIFTDTRGQLFFLSSSCRWM